MARGGLGVVYLAYHPHLKIFRAVKRPLEGDGLERDIVLGRFRREMQAVGSLNSNHITRAFDAGWGGVVTKTIGLHPVVNVYGAIDYLDLQPGDMVTVDTGHVVAYDLGIQFRMRRAVEGRSVQSMKSGEGWVFDFAGPGRVLLQTRNPEAFAQWVASAIPGNNPREGLGGGAGAVGHYAV